MIITHWADLPGKLFSIAFLLKKNTNPTAYLAEHNLQAERNKKNNPPELKGIRGKVLPGELEHLHVLLEHGKLKDPQDPQEVEYFFMHKGVKHRVYLSEEHKNQIYAILTC